MKRRGIAACVVALMLAASMLVPTAAWAQGDGATEGAPASQSAAEGNAGSEALEAASDAKQADGSAAYGEVTVSAEADAALMEGADFALGDFSRAQKGSNRDQDGVYRGYCYYMGSSADYAVAVATEGFVVVHVPQGAANLCDISSPDVQGQVKQYFIALDNAAMNGGVVMGEDVPWYFTSDASYAIDGVVFNFGQEVKEGSFYTCVIGEDGSDVVSDDTVVLTHADFAHVVAPDEVEIALPAQGFAAFQEFLSDIDFSPLWVTLKTTGTAIVFIFILGLAAAYFSLRIPKRAQDIADTVFTIPMVLPPTVCGFLLLWVLGNNTGFGRWLASMNIHLTFSWEATVIAAVVVAFPLMYRSARGAFENLDPNMLDAARTLGWSNLRIFFKLMLPLSWSSIAAGTVLAFARALGEFGATLFLAGNYVGITRTIPIAIYFEWMSGNWEVAMFWTVIIIIFSFIVILFINLWSRRTTKYRRRVD